MKNTNISPDIKRAYWRANLKLMSLLLFVWAAVSLGAGILFVDQLNTVSLSGFKLGFWFAQQGSIYTFLVLVFVYVALVNRLERKFGLGEDEAP
ncbi:MAG: DUF4212 domain-containing protein [Bradymonadia bacterium]